MSNSRLLELISKYNSGTCSVEEKKMLEEWYQSFEWNDKNDIATEETTDRVKNEVWLAIQNSKTFGMTASIKRASQFKWLHLATAAAAVVAIIAVTTFSINQPVKKPVAANPPGKTEEPVIDIKPGTSKAELVLASGKAVALDAAGNMQLKEEDGTSIDKQSGKLIYTDDKAAAGKILFNTLSTPRGGEYQLQLPDGSKVWLNAASSLKFPTHFEGSNRTVFLHGEAYFEVAKNTAMPFHVKLDNDMDVEVTGTHFNIMGYNDEGEIKTTLEEGAVKVTHQNSTAMLAPSKEAVIKRGYANVTVKDADVGRAIAWKNGTIEFNGDDLPAIMRQLSRWYDVDISFVNGVPPGTYKGAIRRQAPLSAMLKILKLAGVKFKMEQKTLLVTGG